MTADNRTTADPGEHLTTARIEADPSVPLIRITRDFRATPAQVIRAHIDPQLYAAWCGPADISTRIDRWDAHSGGSWAFTNWRAGADAEQPEEYSFHGCFHEVGPERIVQTFTFDPMPQQVSLETLTVEDLGDGWSRLHAQSLVDSFEGRDQWLASGMETGVNDGYAKLDALIADGTLELGV